jgi:hypothetical protein
VPSIAATSTDDSEGFSGLTSKAILDNWVDELGSGPVMTDHFAGRRQEVMTCPVRSASNLAWRLLLLNLWSVLDYLGA